MVRTRRSAVRMVVGALCLGTFLLSPGMATPAGFEELESSFRQFLAVYISEMKKGNRQYLETVHPSLPGGQQGFFIGITLDMMKYADEEQLEPEITCREYSICKATWPQPGGSWAAQTFIRRHGEWKWLDY